MKFYHLKLRPITNTSAWQKFLPTVQMNEILRHSNDLLPTITDLTGTPLPSNIQFDGISLKPLFDSKEIADRGSVFGTLYSQRQNIILIGNSRNRMQTRQYETVNGNCWHLMKDLLPYII